LEDQSVATLLIGQRFRVQSRVWVVGGAHVEGDQLFIEFRERPDRPITLELPAGFEPNSPEHRAWLLFNIERALTAW
jgi:hypothetical protein